MAKKDAYKYSVYNAVSKKLKADGVEGAGVVAKILLETFLERKGELKAAHVYGKKTKPKKGQPSKKLVGDEVGINFKAWRKKLEDLGWISYDEDFAARTKRYCDHQAGHKLIEYLNEEKKRLAELATMKDIRDLQAEKADRTETDSKIEALQSEIQALKERLSAVEALGYRGLKALSFVERLAKSTLGDNAPEDAVARLVENMLDGSDEGEEAAPLETTLLA